MDAKLAYRIHVSPAFYFKDTYGLYFVRYEENCGEIHGKALTLNGWVDKPENTAITPIYIPREDLIGLADSLWQNKIKPPEFFNSVGEQAATEKHLEDMRRIAFFKLGLK